MSSHAPAVKSALIILEYMSDVQRSLSIAELSRETGINKNMISRILSELIEQRWVSRDEEAATFRITLQPFQIFSRILSGMTLHTLAIPVIKAIWQQTKESTQLAILKDNRAFYIQQLDSTRMVRVASAVGGNYPLHCTAPGKVLLAWAAEDDRHELLSGELVAYTANTITAPAALRRELETVRRQGYALDREEFSRGIVCCAAPVFDYTGSLQGAVGISSSTVYGSAAELFERFGQLVINGANQISSQLGWQDRNNHFSQ